MMAFTLASWWGLLIVDGIKTVENRAFRARPGRYLVHCSCSLSPDGYLQAVRWIRSRPGLEGVQVPSYAACARAAGMVVGSVQVDGWTRETADPWWDGVRYGWELRTPKRIDPVPAKGMLGLWRASDALMEELRRARARWLEAGRGMARAEGVRV